MSDNNLLLKVLNVPKFVYKYARRKNTVPNLQHKIELQALGKKYAEYESSYNTFALFQWRKQDYTWFNKEYYWQEFARSYTADEPTIFLREKLNNEAMRSCLQSSLPQGASEYRCAFQNISGPGPLKSMLKLTKAENAKLELNTLGLRTEGNNMACYIQSFLEESENMYKDLSYEKLLSIARHSEKDKNSSIRQLINDLAETGLTSSSIVNDSNWLILTRV
ncbi:CBT1 (YKL208W) [Zygosaccharomyces parabailii]|nr:CBT1 (YKL208W) [Zygosaccharomyces parabailii]CDH13235.1 uncharacterized protein ZBAI_05021 [Zygosaccharomyces bailii ISA1307]